MKKPIRLLCMCALELFQSSPKPSGSEHLHFDEPEVKSSSSLNNAVNFVRIILCAVIEFFEHIIRKINLAIWFFVAFSEQL